MKVREAVRKVAGSTHLDELKALFAAHPYPVEPFLEAVLAGNNAPNSHGSPNATNSHDAPDAPRTEARGRLHGLPVLLDRFRHDAQISRLFDEVAEAQRTWANQLMVEVTADFRAAAGVLGAPLLAPTNLIVIPNPLEAQDDFRMIEVKGVDYVVVGGGEVHARRAILEAAARPVVAQWVDDHYRSATRFQKSWESLGKAAPLSRRFRDGKAYLTEVIARAIAYRVIGRGEGAPKPEARDGDGGAAERDGEFLEEAQQAGLHWMKPVFSMMLDAGTTPLKQALPKILSRQGPPL